MRWCEIETRFSRIKVIEFGPVALCMLHTTVEPLVHAFHDFLICRSRSSNRRARNQVTQALRDFSEAVVSKLPFETGRETDDVLAEIKPVGDTIPIGFRGALDATEGELVRRALGKAVAVGARTNLDSHSALYSSGDATVYVGTRTDTHVDSEPPPKSKCQKKAVPTAPFEPRVQACTSFHFGVDNDR